MALIGSLVRCATPRSACRSKPTWENAEDMRAATAETPYCGAANRTKLPISAISARKSGSEGGGGVEGGAQDTQEPGRGGRKGAGTQGARGQGSGGGKTRGYGIGHRGRGARREEPGCRGRDARSRGAGAQNRGAGGRRGPKSAGRATAPRGGGGADRGRGRARGADTRGPPLGPGRATRGAHGAGTRGAEMAPSPRFLLAMAQICDPAGRDATRAASSDRESLHSDAFSQVTASRPSRSRFHARERPCQIANLRLLRAKKRQRTLRRGIRRGRGRRRAGAQKLA